MHLGDGLEADRKVAASFYHALAVYHAKAGNREASEKANAQAVEAWPEIRLALLDDPTLSEEIF
jgi:hypothetical protein